MTNTTTTPLLTADEAAELLRVNKRTVTRLCCEGELKSVRIGRQWRINAEELMKRCGVTA